MLRKTRFLQQSHHLPTTILIFLCAVSTAISVEPPQIDRLYPAGGQQGTSVNVELGGKPAAAALQSWCSHDQLQVTIADDRKFANVVIPADAEPGVHWLRFFNATGVSDPRAFIVGHTTETVEEESNDLPAQAEKITDSAVTVNGVLGTTGDVDTYRIQVPAGRTLVASMEANRQLGSPMDAILQILNAQGTVVAQNDDDHAMDPQIAYEVPSEGDYFVRTFAFPSAPNSTIKLAGAATYVYRLTITHGPFIDHVFPAVVDQRSDSAVTICGWNLVDQQQTVGITAFHDQQRYFGRDFALPHTVYGVTHSSQVESEVSRALAVNSSISGRVARVGEKDEYTLPGTQGQKLTVSVKAREIYSLLDPVLIIRSAGGKVLSEVDDLSGANPDVETTITVPDDGPLSVTVEDRYQSGGYRYFYVLTCQETQPTVTATVGADQYVADKDEAIDVPITITRKNGFAEPLTVSLERLPEGITAKPVISEKDGDTSKLVTLKLHRSQNAAAFSGAIQVLCRSENHAHRQFATAAIPNSQATTSEIWLTVIPMEKKTAAPKGAEQGG